MAKSRDDPDRNRLHHDRHKERLGASPPCSDRLRNDHRKYSDVSGTEYRYLRKRLSTQHPLSGSSSRLVPAAHLPWYRSDDRLLGPHLPAKTNPHRSRGPDGHLRSLSARDPLRFRAERGGSHRHHRRRGRSYGHLPLLQTRPGSHGSHRSVGLLLHGPCACHPASYHAGTHLQEGKAHQDKGR